MAGKFNDFLVNLFMPMLKAAAKFYLKIVIQQIQDHNTPAIYENTLKSINSSFTLLDEVAKKSKTHIDDDIIEAVLESVRESATEDNITL
jgi:flagellar capping protein FliD